MIRISYFYPEIIIDTICLDILYPTYRDVKQVYPSRSVPYRSGLVIERVTAGLSHADCGFQNAGPNPYRRIYRPSRTVPRDASLSNRLL